MNKLFVPYEISLKLKEKGFGENCIYHFKKDEKSDNHSNNTTFEISAGVSPFGRNHNELPTRVSAPLYQQVVDWLREKKDVDITIMPVFREKCGYDSFKRDGYTFEIMRIEPCQYLDWASFNRCAEDRDTEAKEYPPEERVLIPSFKNHYEALDKAIEEALKLI